MTDSPVHEPSRRAVMESGHDMSEGQASAEIEVTAEMIEAAIKAYDLWEPDHIFDPLGGPVEFAVRELAVMMYRAMILAKGREILKTKSNSQIGNESLLR